MIEDNFNINQYLILNFSEKKTEKLKIETSFSSKKCHFPRKFEYYISFTKIAQKNKFDLTV